LIFLVFQYCRTMNTFANAAAAQPAWNSFHGVITPNTDQLYTHLHQPPLPFTIADATIPSYKVPAGWEFHYTSDFLVKNKDSMLYAAGRDWKDMHLKALHILPRLAQVDDVVPKGFVKTDLAIQTAYPHICAPLITEDQITTMAWTNTGDTAADNLWIKLWKLKNRPVLPAASEDKDESFS